MSYMKRKWEDEQEALEAENATLRKERDEWKQRAEELSAIVKADIAFTKKLTGWKE